MFNDVNDITVVNSASKINVLLTQMQVIFVNSIEENESAKLRALRAKNVLTCQRSLRAHVQTCLVCLHANVPCVLTCSCAKLSCVLTCQHASFDATIFSFAAIVAAVVHTIGKV